MAQNSLLLSLNRIGKLPSRIHNRLRVCRKRCESATSEGGSPSRRGPDASAVRGVVIVPEQRHRFTRLDSAEENPASLTTPEAYLAAGPTKLTVRPVSKPGAVVMDLNRVLLTRVA